MSEEMVCRHCGKSCANCYVVGSMGPEHRHCYERNNPPKRVTTVAEVINNQYDPVLSRRLCIKYLTSFQPSFQQEFVDEFNRLVTEMHMRRCQES